MEGTAEDPYVGVSLTTLITGLKLIQEITYKVRKIQENQGYLELTKKQR